jgi:hypothetical protein
VKHLSTLALALMLASTGCGDSGASTPCEPACGAGEVCNFGVCTLRCNPACAAGFQCVIERGATTCVGVDASVRDVANDLSSDVTSPPDVTPPDAPPPADVPIVDGPMPVDAPLPDVTVPADAPAPDVIVPDLPPPSDAPSDIVAPMDIPAPMDVTVPTDVPRDTPDVTDTTAPMDVFVRPPCGGAGQPCCGIAGSETACRDGLICNATTRGTCVDVTRQTGECVTSATCGTGRVCGGPTGCGERWCYSCQTPGALAFDLPCNPDMAGRDCNSGVCQRGRCTTACSLGPAGDDECGRVSAGARCVAFYYGINLSDAGVPGRWITLGYCARGCTRATDCADGRACVASANLIDDRLDFVCQTTTRVGATGAACTSGSMCQSGLCVNLGTSAVCMAPCAVDSDCPLALACRAVSLFRPVTGVPYEARGCLPR